MKVLFLTNGHGEDLIAARIIKELGPSAQVTAMPLVGLGEAFNGLNITVIGPRKKMPSGGFLYQSLASTIKDLMSGLVSVTAQQIRLLWEQKGEFDLVVSVGDIVPIVGALLTRTRFFFVGCAKSDHYDYSYTPWEIFLLRKYCNKAFPRDIRTHEGMLKAGIRSYYLGNPMMDGIDVTGKKIRQSADSVLVGILPGTRDDAQQNIEDIMKVAEKLVSAKEKIKFEFAVAASPSQDISKFGSFPGMRVFTDAFGDIISSADVIIGLSGTGNEQAAGLGKPVISFPGRGVQYTRPFAKRQKQLLDGALLLTERDPDKCAAAILELLRSKTRISEMAAAGRERMGEQGASTAIAEAITNADRP